MATKTSPKIFDELKQSFSKLSTYVTITLVVLLTIEVMLFVVIFGFLQKAPLTDWLIELSIGVITLIITIVIIPLMIQSTSQRARAAAEHAFNEELSELRVATKQAQVLQEMSTTLSATLSFERVMNIALDACSLALEDMGIPARALIGGVFLYDKEGLTPVASRRFMNRDQETSTAGEEGIIGTALKEVEIATTDEPKQDPELRNYIAFQNAHHALAIPLRAGFQIFGAMVLATEIKKSFTAEHLKLFNAVASQAVIALQNAQLYQNLEEEKQRIIEADEDARKELARNLHDGPTQSVSAIAMRINFIASLMAENPDRAMEELKKVEEIAKNTTREIRGMLFTLRPLVLESKGLSAAIETAMEKLRESDGLNLRLIGGEYADLLDERAQGTVFYIIEEALGNARKYSKATLIEVRLWREGNLFVVRIKDDGVGFDTEAVNNDYSSRGSLGMVNMRERAERISGSINVESAPNRGTNVTLVVPLEKHGRK